MSAGVGRPVPSPQEAGCPWSGAACSRRAASHADGARAGRGPRRGRAWIVAAALLFVLGSFARAPAQEQTLLVGAQREQPEATCVRIDIAPTLAAHGRSGPAGWVTCDLRNQDQRPHELELRIETWSQRVQAIDKLVLQPGEHARRSYPTFNYGQAPYLRASCDGGPSEQTRTLGGASLGVSLLLVSPHAAATGELQSAFADIVATPVDERPRAVRVRGATVTRSGSGVGVVGVPPEALPEDWTCLAGFDVVVVDGRANLATGQQRAVVDHLAAGGTILALWTDSLGDGPLREVLVPASGPDDDGYRRHGLGRVIVLAAGPDALGRAAKSWLIEGSGASASLRAASGPVPDDMYEPLDIPGLGEAPVVVFFVLLTLFVVLAWFSIVLCRRAGKPLLATVALPVLGFGFAGAILLWGVLAEGLGVRGAVRSLTWLDQRAHVAATHAATTLFAGLTPGALTPKPGTFVGTLAIDERRWNEVSPHGRVAHHGAGNRLAGNLLPARWPTHLVTATSQRARERLRFRRVADGGLEVLAGPGLVPAAPGLVVRDHAGQCFLGEPQGDRVLLRPCDLQAARGFALSARARFDAAAQPLVGPPRLRRAVTGGVQPPPGPARPGELLEGLDGLPPGSYVAWIGDNALFDQLGLDVDWEAAAHLVVGVLAPEDFVD